MLEYKGFHLTVNDDCRKLGGHGEEINLRRQGKSCLVDVEFKGGLQECGKSMLSGPPGLQLVWVREEQLPLEHPMCPVVNLFIN